MAAAADEDAREREAGVGLREERALLRAARAGDTGAFTLLVEPLMQPAFQFAARLLGDRDLAEDVAQDALLKAYAALAGFRGEARFRTWLFRIVHHACTDALRRAARRRETPWFGDAEEGGEAAPSRLADPAPGPEDEALARVTRDEVLRAVSGLPADQRAVVLLRDVHDLSYEEIATVTGQNLGTVKSRLHRARVALRAALSPGRALLGDASPTPTAGEGTAPGGREIAPPGGGGNGPLAAPPGSGGAARAAPPDRAGARSAPSPQDGGDRWTASREPFGARGVQTGGAAGTPRPPRGAG